MEEPNDKRDDIHFWESSLHRRMRLMHVLCSYGEGLVKRAEAEINSGKPLDPLIVIAIIMINKTWIRGDF